MKICPVCAREFPDNVKFCPDDGQTLRAKGPTADLVGQVIHGSYHILKKLGEGGMGAVYLGEHVKMGRKTAIKVMTQAMSSDPDAVSRFNREAQNASRLSHPNICQVYDFGETDDGLIFLVMEFIEGRALTAIVDAEGALPPARAANIVRQAAEALQVAHDQTIVHRDIKPDNIMVVQAKDGADVVKVVDFGIAKAVAGDETGQKVTKTGLVVGTPEYMSPEQLSGDKLDGRSDIYSLALVLYKLLTGVLPFQSDTAQETMIKRLTDEPEPLAVARPDIAFPPGLQAVMDRALARTVDQRYASAAEFGRDLVAAVGALPLPQTRLNLDHVTQAATQLLDGESARQAKRERAAPAPTAARRPVKRFPVVPVVGGVGAVAVLAVIAWLALGKKQAPTLPAADSAGRGAQSTEGAGGAATQQSTTPPGGTPTQQLNRQTTPPGNQRTGGPTPGPTGGPAPTGTPPVTVAVCEDSANAAIRADQDRRTAEARRIARWVFYQDAATPKQKADMAELIATGYEEDTTQALEWLSQALRFATGAQRTRIQSAISGIRGTP